ncbi:MAG TPA: hypothetical protein PKE30_05775, partial [Niabella sp.]|nr:hypothetical protein [Niabella sp.]
YFVHLIHFVNLKAFLFNQLCIRQEIKPCFKIFCVQAAYHHIPALQYVPVYTALRRSSIVLLLVCLQSAHFDSFLYPGTAFYPET